MRANQQTKKFKKLSEFKELSNLRSLSLICLIYLVSLSSLQAQVRIGQDVEPTKGTVLDLSSTSTGYIGGLKLPHVAIANMTQIPTGATGFKESITTDNEKMALKGIVVYNTNTYLAAGEGIFYWNGTKWVKQNDSTTNLNAWLTTGNANTNATNFVGTTTEKPLRFKVNSIHGGIIGATTGSPTSFGFRAGENTSGINNSAFGDSALVKNTTGNNNTAVGAKALALNTANSNTAVGFSSLKANTSGTGNTAVGDRSLASNTTGAGNTAVGTLALYSNKTGTGNTAVGRNTLRENTGNYNTAVGDSALRTNKSGSENIAIGYHALAASSESKKNTAVGYNALLNTTTGEQNTAIGNGAGSGIKTGSNNIAIGYNARVEADSSNQISIGNLIYAVNSTGGISANNQGRVGIGIQKPYRAAKLDINGQIAIRTGAAGENPAAGKVLTSIDNTGLATWRTPVDNDTKYTATAPITLTGTAFGITTGNLTAGTSSATATAPLVVATGTNRLVGGNSDLTVNNTSPLWNANQLQGKNVSTTAPTNGQVLKYNGSAWAPAADNNTTVNAWLTTGNDGITSGNFIGTINQTPLFFKVGQSGADPVHAGRISSIAGGPTSFGYKALAANSNFHFQSNNFNSAFGGEALTANTSGRTNTAMGYRALYANTTGSNNTAVGNRAIQLNTTGKYNTAVGDSALRENVSGNENVAIGVRALTTATSAKNTAVGYNALLSATGEQNTAIGNGAGSGIKAGSNNIAIGVNAQVPSATASNQISIANLIYATGATGVANTGNVGIGTNAPSVKFHINSATNGAFRYVDGTQGADKVLTSNASGVATWQALPATATNAEPWNQIGAGNVATTNPSTANTQDSYLMGRVAIGQGFAHILRGASDGRAWLTVANGPAVIHGITVGRGAGSIESNTVVGFEAMGGNIQGGQQSGDHNTAVGYHSFQFNKEGAQNTAMGSGALRENTIGSFNTAFGYLTLNSNTSEVYNTAIGYQAMKENINGNYNTAVGSYTLFGNKSEGNTAIGFYTMEQNISGINNVAIGREAMRFNNKGDSGMNPGNGEGDGNVAIGYRVLHENVIGNYNVGIGYGAMLNNKNGWDNIAIGRNAMANNDMGGINIAIGSGTLNKNERGYNNIAIGENALNSNADGNNNIAIGKDAFISNANGNDNIVLGRSALSWNTTGEDNVAIGREALGTNMTSQNVAIGTYAMRWRLYGGENHSRNTAIGFGAMMNGNDSCNVAIGYRAMGLEAGHGGGKNTALGANAGFATNGNLNTMMGYNAGYKLYGGNNNVITGGNTALNMSSGDGNVIMGSSAATSMIRGLYNTIIGAYAGLNMTDGTNNIIIGNGAAVPLNSGNDQISIGNLIYGFNATGDAGQGTINIGSDAVTAYKLNVAGTLNHSGAITNNSDRRFKKDITTISDPLSIIEQLRGTSYQFRTEEFPDKGFSEGKQLGVIAQEVEKVLPELVTEDVDGYKSVNYNGFIPVLIESIKTQQTEIDSLLKIIDQLETRLKAVEATK